MLVGSLRWKKNKFDTASQEGDKIFVEMSIRVFNSFRAYPISYKLGRLLVGGHVGVLDSLPE